MYNLIKMLHVLPAVVFIANIFIGLFWMIFAVRSKDKKIIHFAVRSVNILDKYLTIPSVVLLILFGTIMMSSGNYSFFKMPWIFWSSVMILISGLIFGIILTPQQRKLEAIAAQNNFDKEQFQSLYKSWLIWGTIALVTPVMAFTMMIIKIPN